ncbi:roadblock/LC7 domain-containing protein [Halomonadaceae bacterium KBTZ08]
MSEIEIGQTGEALCRKVFGEMMAKSDAVYGVLVSSVDGHDVVHSFKSDLASEKLSAMLGSMLALGQNIAEEADQKRCQFVIVENSDGYILTLRLKEELVLSVIASTDANLGILHSLSRNGAERLASHLK